METDSPPDPPNVLSGPFWDFVAGRLPAPPAAELLGLRVVRADADRAEFEATFQARSEFVNPTGNVQGGFLAAMLDETLGPALATTLAPDEFAPTLELKVNFLRAAAPGVLTGRGRVVHRGGHIAFLAGELLADGTTVATATATATATARVLKHDWTATPPK
jgi:uncharacterized protein (TIGR00369 family)